MFSLLAENTLWEIKTPVRYTENSHVMWSWGRREEGGGREEEEGRKKGGRGRKRKEGGRKGEGGRERKKGGRGKAGEGGGREEEKGRKEEGGEEGGRRREEEGGRGKGRKGLEEGRKLPWPNLPRTSDSHRQQFHPQGGIHPKCFKPLS